MASALSIFPDVYVPTFEIKVGGIPLEAAMAKTILEVSVTEHMNPPSEFSFRLNDPTLKFINKTAGVFVEGTRVEIALGYVGNTEKMIVGEITELTAEFPDSGPATLEVYGGDLLSRLTRGTSGRRFGEATSDGAAADSDIVTKVAQEMNLTASVDVLSPRAASRVQNHVTNLAFLESLAEANDCTLWVEGDLLHFERQAPAAGTVQLEWGKTLMSFSPRLSTAGQVNAVEVRGWDPVQRQSISGRAPRESSVNSNLAPSGQQQIARGAGGQSELVIQDSSASSTQEAEARADKILSELQQGLITGNGTSVGRPDIHAGTLLDLRGIGRFEGNYVVRRVTHTVGGNGYQSSFDVTLQV